MELLNTIYKAAKETADNSTWVSEEDIFNMMIEYYKDEGIHNELTGNY